MPYSDAHHLTDVMVEIDRISPKRVVDLGVGAGIYGALCRNLLDARFGRCRPDKWEAMINGYEVFWRYENPIWQTYNNVWVENFAERHWIGNYDLVLMIDSLEHLAPEVGRPFLRGLLERNRHVIVSVPNGRMDQGEVYNNPHEAHLWTFNGVEEFAGYDFKLIHQSVCTVVSIKGKLI